MKITKPLFTDHATGAIANLGYFSGPIGQTRFTAPPLAPTRARGTTELIKTRFRAALKRWYTRDYAAATPWREFSPLQLRATPAISNVINNTRQATHPTVLSSHLRTRIHEPN